MLMDRSEFVHIKFAFFFVGYIFTFSMKYSYGLLNLYWRSQVHIFNFKIVRLQSNFKSKGKLFLDGCEDVQTYLFILGEDVQLFWEKGCKKVHLMVQMFYFIV